MVSGTGERTIASWAALALVVGLSLSAAPAAHSATETATVDPGDPAPQTALDESVETAEPGEPPGDDDIATPTTGDELPTGSPSPTKPTEPPNLNPSDPETTVAEEPDPTESETTASEEPEPTDPEEPDPTDTSGSESEGPPPVEFSCNGGGMVTPGQQKVISCTVPENFELEVQSPGSHGGTAVSNETDITYTAPATFDGAASEIITVQAIPIEGGEPLTDSVTFSFDGASNGDGNDEQNDGGETEDAEGPGGEPTSVPTETQTLDPSPSEPGTTDHPDNSEQTPTPTSPVEPDAPPETEPGSSDQPEPTEVTSEAQTPDLPQLPGAPGDPSIELPQSVIPHLPVPGMPDPGSESIAPEPTADASEGSAGGTDDGAGEGEPEDDEGGLAQTGPEQVAWSGSLAASAIVLGITALALSRRQTQRS